MVRQLPMPEVFVLAGAKIKALLEGRGWTLEQLAVAADIGRNTLLAVEKGETDSYSSTYAKIALALHVDLDEIFSKDPTGPYGDILARMRHTNQLMQAQLASFEKELARLAAQIEAGRDHSS